MMKMSNLKSLLFLMAASLLLLSCSQKVENKIEESAFIQLSTQQFELNQMQLGKVKTTVFERVVYANGMIVPLPNGSARLNAPIQGTILRVHCKEGQRVEKNQSLIEIGGVDLLDLQKEFAIVSAGLKRLKVDYERIKLLYDAKATTEKEFVLAEAEYKASLANYNGLKLKIQSVGLSPSKVENGDFLTSYGLKSPISGIVTQLQARLGQHLNAQSEILDIIDSDLLQVKLAIFPQDISSIQPGQLVRIKMSGKEADYQGSIQAVGVALDEDSKSVTCYASFVDAKIPGIISNMFVESEIVIRYDTVQAIPKSALIKSENDYYVLSLVNQEEDLYQFSKQLVRIGKENRDFVEVLDNKIDGLVLTKGAYTINLSE